MDPLAEITPTDDRGTGRARLMLLFWVAVVASLVLPLIPYGRTVLYPFALLGTWAHEMGHGLAAILVGGGFEKLEVYSDLGGVAFSSGVGSFGQVIVSFGGLLGPAIFGGLVIVFGSRPGAARWVVAVTGFLVLLSVALVVRNGFGIASLGLIGLVLVAIGFKAPNLVRQAVAQLIGVQFCLASWGSLDYMFTKGFERDGQFVDSDTQNIAEVLFAPYWFWGGVTVSLSATILLYSFYRAWIRPERSSVEPVSDITGTM